MDAAAADDEHEWEKVWARGEDEITEQVRPYVVALADGIEPLGSGLLVRQRGRHYVFTVGHVVEECRRPLANGSLRLWARTSRGDFSLRDTTTLLGRYRPDAEPYQDGGVLVLDPRDAPGITAWSNNIWYVLPDIVSYREVGLPMAERNRIYFATGIAPRAPEGKRAVGPHEVAYSYVAVNFKRHPDRFHRGVFKFMKGPQWYPSLRRSAEGMTTRFDPNVDVMSSFPLSGMSGAPLWTFEIARDHEKTSLGLLLLGAHSASGDDSLIAVPSSQHFDLLRDHGLLYE